MGPRNPVARGFGHMLSLGLEFYKNFYKFRNNHMAQHFLWEENMYKCVTVDAIHGILLIITGYY